MKKVFDIIQAKPLSIGAAMGRRIWLKHLQQWKEAKAKLADTQAIEPIKINTEKQP